MEIHCERLLRPPIELVLHRQPAVAVLFRGPFIASVKLADLASRYSGASPPYPPMTLKGLINRIGCFKTIAHFRVAGVCVCVCVCVCVILTSSRGKLPSDAVPTARQIHPPQRLRRHTPVQTPHQPLPGEMFADGCPLGNVDETATAYFVGTIPWLPSGIPPGASLCDT
jgi:hypothetical protein